MIDKMNIKITQETSSDPKLEPKEKRYKDEHILDEITLINCSMIKLYASFVKIFNGRWKIRLEFKVLYVILILLRNLKRKQWN